MNKTLPSLLIALVALTSLWPHAVGATTSDDACTDEVDAYITAIDPDVTDVTTALTGLHDLAVSVCGLDAELTPLSAPSLETAALPDVDTTKVPRYNHCSSDGVAEVEVTLTTSVGLTVSWERLPGYGQFFGNPAIDFVNADSIAGVTAVSGAFDYGQIRIAGVGFPTQQSFADTYCINFYFTSLPCAGVAYGRSYLGAASLEVFGLVRAPLCGGYGLVEIEALTGGAASAFA